MNNLVFDASAILAVYYDEPGKQKVKELLDASDPIISSVNLCEVFTKLSEQGLDGSRITESFQALEIRVENFGSADALTTAELRASTKRLGLSLGDRACVALAMRLNAAAVTADRKWQKITACEIELIR